MVFNFGLSAVNASERATLWRSKHIRYRLGRRFMALDYAGNVIMYRAFREKHFGAWAPMTVLDPSLHAVDPLHPTGMATLVSNFPMHVRCAPLSEHVVEMLVKHKRFLEIDFAKYLKEKHVTILNEMAAEEKTPQKKISNEDVEKAAPSGGDATATADDTTTTDEKSVAAAAAAAEEERIKVAATPKKPISRHPATPQEEAPSTLNFAKRLGLKPHKEGYNPEEFIMKDEFLRALGRKRLFRLNRFVTWSFKGIYFACWALFGVFGVVLYTRFKYWLNPPARQGLERIEEDWLRYPSTWVDSLYNNIVYPATDALDDFLYADEVYGSSHPPSTLLDDNFPAAAEACRGVLKPAVEGARAVTERVTSVAMQKAYLQRQRDREAAEAAVEGKTYSRKMRLRALIASLIALLGLLLL